MVRPISFLLIAMLLCCAHLPQPSLAPLLFCPIVLVIVCNAEGRTKEQVGRNRSRCLGQSSEQPCREEHLRQRKLCQDFPSGHRHACL